jgi:hypothetical protein
VATEERMILTDEDISTVRVRQPARSGVRRGPVAERDADQGDVDGGDVDGGDRGDTTDATDRGDTTDGAGGGDKTDTADR